MQTKPHPFDAKTQETIERACFREVKNLTNIMLDETGPTPGAEYPSALADQVRTRFGAFLAFEKYHDCMRRRTGK